MKYAIVICFNVKHFDALQQRQELHRFAKSGTFAIKIPGRLFRDYLNV